MSPEMQDAHPVRQYFIFVAEGLIQAFAMLAFLGGIALVAVAFAG